MAVKYTTRALLRDAARRTLGITPPIDFVPPQGIAGAEPLTQHDPRNPFLNQCIDEELADLNTDSGLSSAPTPLQATITAQTVNGPYGLQLSGGFNLPNSVNSLRHAWWIPTGNTTSYPLEWKSFDDMNGQLDNWQDMPVGVPQYVWMEGYQVKILPGPSTDGILYATASISFAEPNLDTDIITVLPTDFLPIVTDGVVLRVCASNIDDVVRESIYKMVSQRYGRRRGQMVKWINTRNGGSSGYVAGIKLRRGSTFSYGRTR